MFLLGYNMSIASAVGFIALGGVAAEIGVVMVIYLDQAVAARAAQGRLNDERISLKPSSRVPHCVCARLR
jgi:Cu(I)/Ag(I) efflux system membrane protein CusA/SilA